MSKKEKNAIWYCSEILADNENDIEQWKIVENLIDKLQKEVKGFKKENKRLKEQVEEEIHARDCVAHCSVSKNKIKEIIESSSYPDFAIQKIIELLEED